MQLRIGAALIVTGLAFVAMGWLGMLGPAAILAGLTLGAYGFQSRLNAGESSPANPAMRALARVDQPPRAA